MHITWCEECNNIDREFLLHVKPIKELDCEFFLVGKQSDNDKCHLKLTHKCDVSGSNLKHDIQPNEFDIFLLS